MLRPVASPILQSQSTSPMSVLDLPFVFKQLLLTGIQTPSKLWLLPTYNGSSATTVNIIRGWTVLARLYGHTERLDPISLLEYFDAVPASFTHEIASRKISGTTQ